MTRAWLGGVAILVVYAALVWHFWFLADDAFISFRYANNWADGVGLRFNPGEHIPIEGYSNFLWVVVCAVLEHLSLDLTMVVPSISMGCGVVLLWRTHRVLRRDFGVEETPALLAIATLATLPAYAVWSTSGLETMPFALSLFYIFEQLVLRTDRGAPWRASIGGIVLVLIRAEGLGWAIVIGLAALMVKRLTGRRPGRSLFIFAGVILGVTTVYFAWRYLHFHTVIPGTAYTKFEPRLDLFWRGFMYIVSFVFVFLTPLLAIPGFIVGLRGDARHQTIGVAFMFVALYAYAVVVGGDFMPMGRFLIPSLTFQTLLLGVLLQSMWEGKRVWVAVLIFDVIIVGLLPGWNVHIVPDTVLHRVGFREDRERLATEVHKWAAMRGNAKRWSLLGKALAEYSTPQQTLAAGAIGAMGYYSGLFIYDRFGLVTASVRGRGMQQQLVFPGHDKGVEWSFFIPYEPDYLAAAIVPAEKADAIVQRFLVKWSAEQLTTDYVPDLVPAPGVSTPTEVYFLLLLKPVSPDTDTQSFRRQFCDKVHAAAPPAGNLGTRSPLGFCRGSPIITGDGY